MTIPGLASRLLGAPGGRADPALPKKEIEPTGVPSSWTMLNVHKASAAPGTSPIPALGLLAPRMDRAIRHTRAPLAGLPFTATRSATDVAVPKFRDGRDGVNWVLSAHFARSGSSSA